MTAPTADVIEHAGRLEALAPEWWALWRAIPDASPFTSPAWLLPWLRAFGPERLRAVAIRSEGRLVGLAPFWLEDGPLGRRLLPLGIGISDGFDVLLDPERAADAGEAVVAAVHAMPDWTRWELEELPDGAAALALPAPPGCAEETARQSASPVLPLAGRGDPDESVPAGRRRKLRMARHRAARRGAAVERVGPDEAAGFLDDLRGLHGARWASRGEAGVLADPAVERFHAAALPALAEAGLARLHRLRLDGVVAGAFYGLAHGRRASAYLGGFDPAFAFESPGAILVGHAIAEAAREGATDFDFLRGREPYKYEWGATDRWSLRRSFRRVAPGG